MGDYCKLLFDGTDSYYADIHDYASSDFVTRDRICVCLFVKYISEKKLFFLAPCYLLASL
jgi:hypothetical protein